MIFFFSSSQLSISHTLTFTLALLASSSKTRFQSCKCELLSIHTWSSCDEFSKISWQRITLLPCQPEPPLLSKPVLKTQHHLPSKFSSSEDKSEKLLKLAPSPFHLRGTRNGPQFNSYPKMQAHLPLIHLWTLQHTVQGPRALGHHEIKVGSTKEQVLYLPTAQLSCHNMRLFLWDGYSHMLTDCKMLSNCEDQRCTMQTPADLPLQLGKKGTCWRQDSPSLLQISISGRDASLFLSTDYQRGAALMYLFSGLGKSICLFPKWEVVLQGDTLALQ